MNLSLDFTSPSELSFKFPSKMFKLKVPSFVNIAVSSSQLVHGTFGNHIEVRKDQNLLLRVHLTRNDSSMEPVSIKMNTVLIHCHG